jgi:hypothetical protein
MKDLTQIERGEIISFFNELDIETRTMLVTSVSFFNKVDLEMQKLSSEVVSFLNELEIRKPCSKTYVSFFNEVASDTQKTTRVTFVSDHGFQEDNSLE